VKFETIRKCDNLRVGKLTLREDTLETPAMFYGFYPYDPPFWKLNGEKTPVVISAYHFLRYRMLLEERGVRNVLNSRKERTYFQKYRKSDKYLGPIFMDSGGYSFLSKGRLDVKQIDILKLQEKSKADIGATLDWPIDPQEVAEKDRWKRLYLTIENARIALENRKDREMLLMAVVHGWDEKSINWCVENLLRIEQETGCQFDIFAIGSLVPHSLRRLEKAVDILTYAKKALPEDRPLHIFGLGGLTTIPLLLFLGFDMFDSSTYVLSAVDRWYFLPNFKRVKLADLDKIQCKCKICRSIKCKEELLTPRKELLALHNFFVLERECRLFIDSVKANSLEESINKYLPHNRKLKMICDYSKTLKTAMPTSD
jgi:7-cyano-7-deazaguanine tRNA-ribosyltransferase